MTPQQMFDHTRNLCVWWAKRENARIRMARLAGTPHEAALQEELSFCNTQVERLRQDPRYEPAFDPAVINTSHTACEVELEQLRVANMQLRVKKQELWEVTSDLKYELGKLRKTRHDLPGTRKNKGGRPPKHVPSLASQAARLGALVGVQGVTFDEVRYVVAIRRPAFDKLMRMLQEKEAEEAQARVQALSA